MTKFDAIVIGTGQAGPYIAQRFAAKGMKTAIVERKLFGGTCVNTGCTPTKAMVASAYAMHIARRASEYGVTVDGPVRADMPRIKARTEAITSKSSKGIESWLKKMENCTVYEGHARFESAHEISVGAERLTAEKIFINTGGRASVPQFPGLD
jgi:pyruvate/2-oxoglutarate dehydrogenase complex dihydrolipoamide dehydrogenase (E3) component